MEAIALFCLQVAVIYMCTRLIVNVSQVYTPLYVLEVLDLDRVSS